METTDNLHNADGQQPGTDNQHSAEINNDVVNDNTTHEADETAAQPEENSPVETLATHKKADEAEEATPPAAVDIASETAEAEASTPEELPVTESIKTLDPEAEAIAAAPAETSKPKKETKPAYDATGKSMEELVADLRMVAATGTSKEQARDVKAIREAYEDLDKAARAAHEKKVMEDPAAKIADFQYFEKTSKEYRELINAYRDARKAEKASEQKKLIANLDRRNEIIEQIKELVNVPEDANNRFTQFQELQKAWKETGSIPHDKYDTTWKNYRLYVDKFYDDLSLSNEMRDLDFAHNLDLKNNLIEQAVKLAEETDIHKAIRGLNQLHKAWKEDTGPVSREHREPIWEKFQEASKVIHDRRDAHYKMLEGEYEENAQMKEILLRDMAELIDDGGNTHNHWQKKIKQFEEKRELFHQIGKAPEKKNKELWSRFKDTSREFNRRKNKFYKDMKAEQAENLRKKRELVEVAESLQAADFQENLNRMKQIQEEWKQIGHVPRKESDKLWKKFRAACNAFFDQRKEERKAENAQEAANLAAKRELLEATEKMELDKDPKKGLAQIKEKIAAWNKIGFVPRKNMGITKKWQSLMDVKFEQLGMNRQDAANSRYETRLATIHGDERMMQVELRGLKRRSDELKKEILQLENNLNFFKHASPDNPMVVDVNKNIARLRKDVEDIRQKQIKLKTYKPEADADAITPSSEEE